MIHVFIGTKAQTIKMAPVMQELIRRDIPFRFIDTGQHAEITGGLRKAFALPDPDISLSTGRSVRRLGHGLYWGMGIVSRVLQTPRRLRQRLFHGEPGVVLLHGDNASTILGAILARRAKLEVALVEAGLRSHNLMHPFPEEAFRCLLPHMAQWLFPPSPEAELNLQRMRVRGKIVSTSGNTILDAMAAVLGPLSSLPDHESYGLWNCHRLENLFVASRLDEVGEMILEAAERGPIRFVLDAPTAPRLEKTGWRSRLEKAGVEFLGLMDYPEFLQLLIRSRYVATDGGSIQEECAALGVPCLLLRKHTERPDGLDDNVVLGRTADDVRMFLRDVDRFRRSPRLPSQSPAARIVDALVPTGPDGRRGTLR